MVQMEPPDQQVQVVLPAEMVQLVLLGLQVHSELQARQVLVVQWVPLDQREIQGPQEIMV